MKKKLLIGVISLLSLSTLISCNKEETKKLESISIESGFKSQYFLNEEISNDDLAKLLKVNLNYDDKTSSLVNVKDYLDTTSESYFTLGEIDTSSVGSKVFTLTYSTKIDKEVIKFETTANYTIKEKTAEDYEVQQIILPNKITNSNASKNDFINKNSSYKVGSFNEIDLYPEVIAYDEDMNEITLVGRKIDVKFEIKTENGDYKELNETEVNNLVSYEDTKLVFKFNPSANNNTFKLTYSIFDTIDVEPISFIIDIVDAYNVTDVNELSLFNNVGNLWDAYYNEHQENEIIKKISGINKNDIHGLVLHDNLKIYKEHIPSGFFFNSNEVNGKEVGSLKNDIYIYERELPSTLTENHYDFDFYGNYFTIDNGGKRDENGNVIPGEELLVIRKNNNETNWSSEDNDLTNFADSRTALFRIESLGAINHQVETLTQDLRILGNSPKSASKRGSGGFCVFNYTGTNHTYDNIISNANYIPIKGERPNDCKGTYNEENDSGLTTHTIKNTKLENSFQCAIYSYGAEFDISSSNLNTCGGPVLFGDAVLDEEHTGYKKDYPAKFIVDESSILESYVDGTEAWFAAYGATAVITQFQQFNNLFKNQYQHSFYNNENKFNLVSFFKNKGESLQEIGSKENPHYNYSIKESDTSSKSIFNTDDPRFISAYDSSSPTTNPGGYLMYNQPLPIVTNGNNYAAIYPDTQAPGIYDMNKLAMKLASSQLPTSDDYPTTAFNEEGYLALGFKVPKAANQNQGFPLGIVINNYHKI